MKTVSFTSSVTLPDGTYVSCTVVVPKRAAHADVMETNELAGMGANHVANHINRALARRNERSPF